LNRVFDAGTGKTTSLKELIRVLEEVLGKRVMVKKIERRQGDVDVSIADISALKTAVGWSPKVSLKDGIRRMVKEYESKVSTA
jgi:nucleoside-diphosphate-sugar epimerase